jgi:hypothetical protein
LQDSGGNSLCYEVHVFHSFLPYRFKGNHSFSAKLENDEFGCPNQVLNFLRSRAGTHRVFVDIELFVIIFTYLKVLAPKFVDGSHLVLAEELCFSLSHRLEFVNRYENL